MTLGQCLEMARLSKGMDLITAGKESGVSFRAIRSWERDEHSPQFDKLEALCLLAYKMPVAKVLIKYHYDGEPECPFDK